MQEKGLRMRAGGSWQFRLVNAQLKRRRSMRKIGMLCALLITGAWGAEAWAQTSGCPGLSGCSYSYGCPPGSILVFPWLTIQGEIDAAPDSGAILCVGPGYRNETIDFRGKPIWLVSSAGPINTFIDGSGLGPVVTFSTGEGRNSILDGFTILNGQAPYGAGIYINQASPTIRNSIIRGNSATGDSGRGGGIGVIGAQSRPAITCTLITGNTASYAGGGLMSTYSADPYLRSNVFEGNSAQYGGAIGVHWSGRIDLGWTELVANQATVDGGGMHVGVPYGNALVRQAWFRDNTASGFGGGMWVPAGFADVVNSTFTANSANSGGALAAGHGSMVNVASTLFVQNVTNMTGSGALINTSTGLFNTSVVNNFNAFFANTILSFGNTYGNKGLVGLSSFAGSCCPEPGSPALNAGIPDVYFNDPDGSRNDIGACGGPALSTFGPMQ
jgi:parallel beta-helix repeat protein